MPTIRINDAQKINVHGPDWRRAARGITARAGPRWEARTSAWSGRGTSQEVLDLLATSGVTPEAGPATRTCARGPSTSVYFRDPDDNLVELTVYDQRL